MGRFDDGVTLGSAAEFAGDPGGLLKKERPEADFVFDPRIQNFRRAGQVSGHLQRGLADVQGRGFQGAQLDPRFRQAQQGLLSGLQADASGQGVTAGELAIQRQGQRAVAGQQALAAGSRGGNAALAQRQAARGIQDIGVASAGQAGQARLEAQQAARGQLGGLIGQEQQFQISNLNAQLQARGLDDRARAEFISQMFGIDQAEVDAMLKREQIIAGVSAAEVSGGAGQGTGGLGETAAAAGPIIAAFSDRRKKKRIKSADERLHELLKETQAFEYEYKDPEDELAARGKRIGVMAQDLEKTELGKQFVKDTPKGKVVDYGQGMGTITAALSFLNRRLDKVEAG